MTNLENTLKNYAEEFIGDGEHFLIGVERASKNSNKYAVIVDGDQGVSIDYCAQLSRHISKKVDEELGDDVAAFTYEVTTPGVDKPLVLERQFPKHIGRSIKFTLGDKDVKGKLIAVEKGTIQVEVETKEKGKKKPLVEEESFLIKDIQEPKIIISFK